MRIAFHACTIGLLSAHGALAAVTISSAATRNMSCSNGVCAPTAKQAVLNAGDLEGFLASGNLAVTTTGSGVQADDIHVRSALGWSNSSTLSLEAHRSIAINAPVSITGLSGLALDTGKKRALSFGGKGNVSFANLSSQLTINGAAYTLVADIKTLAADIAANPGGDFALANNYDASADGTYSQPPIVTVFTGAFEGLGNAISNFSIDGTISINREFLEGLFAELGTNGLIENIDLANANVTCSLRSAVKIVIVASLVAQNFGTVRDFSASGAVRDQKPVPHLGGLVGWNHGTILSSHADVAVSAGRYGSVGGLANYNFGTISKSYATGAVLGEFVGGLVAFNFGRVTDSFATGDVQVTFPPEGKLVGGGLVEVNSDSGTIRNSYATGAVIGGEGSVIGGLVGENDNTVGFSYSTGAVTGGTASIMGGLIGKDSFALRGLFDNYWDTKTSGQSQGVGNIPNDRGVTGLTTAQFQSGLPHGFRRKVWTEKANIIDGFPYLLSNPPPKPE
ncbi:MAG TPA: hypothetical protein VGI20_12785 [Rhizomicrobium sp.]|jgi:hypothetical protein